MAAYYHLGMIEATTVSEKWVLIYYNNIIGKPENPKILPLRGFSPCMISFFLSQTLNTSNYWYKGNNWEKYLFVNLFVKFMWIFHKKGRVQVRQLDCLSEKYKGCLSSFPMVFYLVCATRQIWKTQKRYMRIEGSLLTCWEIWTCLSKKY